MNLKFHHYNFVNANYHQRKKMTTTNLPLLHQHFLKTCKYFHLINHSNFQQLIYHYLI